MLIAALEEEAPADAGRHIGANLENKVDSGDQEVEILVAIVGLARFNAKVDILGDLLLSLFRDLC